MKHLLSHWRGLLFSLMVFGTITTLTSCGNDEPESTVIDYYVSIEKEFLVNGSTSRTDRFENPITRMRTAIATAYPTPNTQGDDDAVIAACDKEYETYLSLYTGGKDHFTCLFHLVRATKKDGIVKSNETLKTYWYDINPVETDGDGDD